MCVCVCVWMGVSVRVCSPCEVGGGAANGGEGRAEVRGHTRALAPSPSSGTDVEAAFATQLNTHTHRHPHTWRSLLPISLFLVHPSPQCFSSSRCVFPRAPTSYETLAVTRFDLTSRRRCGSLSVAFPHRRLANLFPALLETPSRPAAAAPPTTTSVLPLPRHHSVASTCVHDATHANTHRTPSRLPLYLHSHPLRAESVATLPPPSCVASCRSGFSL